MIDTLLNELRVHAKANWIPILKQDTESFLKNLLLEIKPINILEIGTAIAYSSIVFSEILDNNVKIDTIERNPDMVIQARENLKLINKSNVNVIEGDALDIIPKLDKKYDFIFIDANKTKYPEYLKMSFDLINIGGYIVADNISYGGIVFTDVYPTHKHRSAVNALRKFVKEVKEDNRLTTEFHMIGDGISVSRVNSL